MKYVASDVKLTSPTFGNTMTVRSPAHRLATSAHALSDLQTVESQIRDFQLPDFGYSGDNYLLQDK